MEKAVKFNTHDTLFYRILHFPVIQIIIAIIFVNIPTFILRSITQYLLTSLSLTSDTVNTVIIFFVRILTVYFAYYLFVKIFEKREAREISISISSMKSFFYGFLFGLLSIFLIMGLIWITGNFSIMGVNSSATLFESFLYHSFFAFLQDIVYFAIIFRILERWIGSWGSIAIAALIFGFKHLLFPGYTLWSVIAQSFEAGILFSALYIFSRNIWLILGFHTIWNFIEYGFILDSSDGSMIPLFISEFSGSNLITGMPVGPEASLYTFAIFTSIGIYLLAILYKRGDIMLPSWKRGINA
jgi:membrane protease YdiL (CAAX protease family)